MLKITTVFWCLCSTPLVFSISQESQKLYDAGKLETNQNSNAHDASMDLQSQLAVAPLKEPDLHAANIHPQQQPGMPPVSKDAADYKHLPSRTSVASLKDPYGQAVYRPYRPSQKSKKFLTYELKGIMKLRRHTSKFSDDPYEQESLPELDGSNENSPYPEADEEYVSEEEVAEINDEIELTDDFLKDYLNNEDIEFETEQEA